jgi:hypothetical protein
MKYVLVFVLLTCVLSASIKERMETAATERTQEKTFAQTAEIPTNETDCNNAGGHWICDEYGCDCGGSTI